MKQLISLTLLPIILTVVPLHAADKLILDIEMDKDILTLSHNIDGFLFQPTMNFSAEVPGNRGDAFKIPALKNHLVTATLVRIDGKVAGMAAELEKVELDHGAVESSWLFMLNHPKAKGFLAVKQQENPGPIFNLVQEVMKDPEADWEDNFKRVLSTSSPAKIEMASESLNAYKGGRFEEYNYLNPADLKNHKRFRAKLQFVIYPAE